MSNDVETKTIETLGRISIFAAEMYSPTLEAQKFGLQAGEVMDLTTRWDLGTKTDQDRAMRYLKITDPSW